MLGKLYLFRPSSLTLLLACLAAAMLAREVLTRGTANLARRLVALAAVVLFVRQTAHADAKAAREQRLSPAVRDAVEAARRITAPGDVVVVEPVDDFRFPYVRMERLLDHPTLVSWKFVPTNAAEIYRWWDLWRLRQHLFDAGCAGGAAGIPVRYLLVLRPGTLSRVADCGEVAWSSGAQALIRVELRDGGGPKSQLVLTRTRHATHSVQPGSAYDTARPATISTAAAREATACRT